MTSQTFRFDSHHFQSRVRSAFEPRKPRHRLLRFALGLLGLGLIVALSASNNFMTASNPVISMITGPAGYSGKELWRVGGPLSLIYTGIAVLMVNLLF